MEQIPSAYKRPEQSSRGRFNIPLPYFNAIVVVRTRFATRMSRMNLVIDGLQPFKRNQTMIRSVTHLRLIVFSIIPLLVA